MDKYIDRFSKLRINTLKFNKVDIKTLNIHLFTHSGSFEDAGPTIYMNVSGKYKGGSRFKRVDVWVPFDDYRDLKLKMMGIWN